MSDDSAVSAEGRSKEEERNSSRGRRLVTGIATTMLSRGIGVVSPLLLVPVMLKSLGLALFGFWMALTAITSMLAFADLGLGNGLMTRLAPCYANGDFVRAKRYISSAYAVLTCTAVILVIALWTCAPLIPWANLLNAEDLVAPGDARNASLICLTLFLLNIPASLIIRVQYAYQMVGRSNVWQSFGNVASVVLAATAVALDSPGPLVIAAAVAGPFVVNVISSALFFGRQMPRVSPSVGYVASSAAKQLMKLSSRFFVLSAVTAGAMNVDTVIIAHALGLDAAATYSIAFKLFAILGMLINVVNLPLWPANGDALARGDFRWAKRITRTMTLVSLSSVTVVGLILIPLSTPVVAMWLDAPSIDVWIMIGLCMWWAAVAVMSPRFMVQNAAEVTNPQLAGWSAFLLVSLPLKWFMVQKYGLASVPIVGAAVYLVTVAPSAISGYRKALSTDKAALTGSNRDEYQKVRTS